MTGSNAVPGWKSLKYVPDGYMLRELVPPSSAGTSVIPSDGIKLTVNERCFAVVNGTRTLEMVTPRMWNHVRTQEEVTQIHRAYNMQSNSE
jgi:hypothetical protein